jgi:Beta-1,4-xylanase
MYTEQEQNKFNFTDGNYFMDLAERFDSKVRCHNLVWMSQVSDFVTSKTWTAKELTAVMKKPYLQNGPAFWQALRLMGCRQ